MKKLSTLTAICLAGLLACNATVAVAGKPAYFKAGKQFAQVTACFVAGKYNKAETDIINLKIIGKYNIPARDGFWKALMEGAKKDEFKRLEGVKPLELAIMCGIVKDRYL